MEGVDNADNGTKYQLYTKYETHAASHPKYQYQSITAISQLQLYQLTYPRPLPDHTSNPVALVKQGVVGGREAGVLEQQAALQTLPLQGEVLLPLKGLH